MNDSAALFTRLAERASALLSKERELDQAIAEVGEPPEMLTANLMSSVADATPTVHEMPSTTLLKRRSSGLEHLRSARDEAAHERASVQLAADNLRIQLLRLRAGAGTMRISNTTWSPRGACWKIRLSAREGRRTKGASARACYIAGVLIGLNLRSTTHLVALRTSRAMAIASGGSCA